MPHIYFAHDLFYDEASGLSNEYLRSVRGDGILLNAVEQAALLILDANITYGEGDDTKNTQLLSWAEELLTDTSHVFLKGRALELGLAIEFYEQGNYEGGAAAAREFLGTFKDVDVDERTNAQIGMIEVVLAEMLVTEPDLDANFDASLSIYKGWQPMNSQSPSTREKVTWGVISQTRGQTYKDKGDWQTSANELTNYLAKFAISGSQNEGWAAGDLAQVLMEMGRLDEAETIFKDHLEKRTKLMTPRERERDRRSDTMFLEINAAELLLLQGRINDAEREYLQLQKRFEKFASRSELPHFEKTGVFFVLCGLARAAQIRGDYSLSLTRWREVLDYSSKSMDLGFQRGKWGTDSYYTGVILISMAPFQAHVRADVSWEGAGGRRRHMILVSLKRSRHKTLIRAKEGTELKSGSLALRDHLSKNRKSKTSSPYSTSARQHFPPQILN